MRHLHKFAALLIFGIVLYACGTSPQNKGTLQGEEPVVIANDSLEYEITIVDPGFNYYLASVAQPEGYYSQAFLESKNRIYVTTWNIRARDPGRYNPNIYQNVVDYDFQIDYGLEVNYKLFNYFEFAQQKYNMSLWTNSNVTRRGF